MITAAEIRGDDRGYIAYHSTRYVLLLKLLQRFGVTAATRVLDIGLSRLSTLIREELGAKVDTLGFGSDSEDENGRHFGFDLNRSQRLRLWRTDLPKYDVVVFAEVIEHLYTAPELVLAFVRSLVADNGLLILATPNAASLTKRVKLMLLGRNPYERIRVDNSNPGHFRECTVAELKAFAESAGFTMIHKQIDFSCDARYAPRGQIVIEPQPILGTAKNIVYRLLPEFLREHVTMVLRAERPAHYPDEADLEIGSHRPPV